MLFTILAAERKKLLRRHEAVDGDVSETSLYWRLRRRHQKSRLWGDFFSSNSTVRKILAIRR